MLNVQRSPPLESVTEEDKEGDREAISSLPNPILPADDTRDAELVGITESEPTPSEDLGQDMLPNKSAETMEPTQSTVETVEPAREATKEEIADEEIAEPEDSTEEQQIAKLEDSTAEERMPEPMDCAVASDETISMEEVATAVVQEGPQIFIQPASPTVEAAKETYIPLPLSPKGADTAQSTSVEGKQSNGNGATKMRNAGAPLESPKMSSSMGSPKKQESMNFLTAFWQKFIVGWLGGLIMRLCGGRRQALLLAVSAVVLVALAPALYLSV